ncbi:MAG: two-component regulator propeller domain-containing protein, partial [Bacteroidota bacterium]
TIAFMPIACIPLFLLCLASLQLCGQQYNFQNYSTKYLPSSEVYCVMQDSKGYIWISTDAGVCRFNGKEFTTFTTADGLTDNTVFNIFEHKERLWFVCSNATVCYYENGIFSPINANKELQVWLKQGSRVIFSQAFDEGDTLWLGTWQGLFSVAPANNYSSVSPDTLFGDSINIAIQVLGNKVPVISRHYNYTHTVFSDGKQAIIPLRCKGLLNFNYKVCKESKYNYDPTSRCVMMKDGRLLFTYRNDLFVYEESKPIQKLSFPSSIIHLSQDTDNNLWIGFSKNGIMRFPAGNLQARPETFLEGHSVSYVCLDYEKGLWFSTLNKGVFYLPLPNYANYSNISFLSGKIVGMSTLRSELFIATEANVIASINASKEPNAIIRDYEIKISPYVNFVSVDNKIYLCGNIVGELDIASKKINYFSWEGKSRLHGLWIKQLSRDSFLVFSINTIETVKGSHSIHRTVLPVRVNCVLERENGPILLGTNNGLYVSDGQMPVMVPGSDSLSNTRIISLAEDAKGRLYIGTKGKGLIIVEKNQATLVSAVSGLASNACNFILPDTADHVWVASNKGISLVKISTPGSFRVIANLDVTYGLPTNEVLKLARLGPSLFAGTKEGLCEIDLSTNWINTVPPVVLISKLYMNGNDIRDGMTEFPYDQNNFSFLVDCFSFKSQLSPHCYVKLVGFDKEKKLVPSGLIEYNNLPPGSYTLEVYGINNSHMISEARTFSFMVYQPWWFSWWFLSLAATSLAGSVGLIVRKIIGSIKRKERQKTEINRQLSEYQMTALKTQMNPHFIFNCINSIQHLILTEKNDMAYNYLNQFASLVRTVLEYSQKDFIALSEEKKVLANYLELEKLRFGDSFGYTLEINGLDESKVFVPTMIIQPFAENAIWHGLLPSKEKRELSIRIARNSDKLDIWVRDNGIGINNSAKKENTLGKSSIALKNIEKRIKLFREKAGIDIHLRISDRSEVMERGTEVLLSIPLIYNTETHESSDY